MQGAVNGDGHQRQQSQSRVGPDGKREEKKPLFPDVVTV